MPSEKCLHHANQLSAVGKPLLGVNMELLIRTGDSIGGKIHGNSDLNGKIEKR